MTPPTRTIEELLEQAARYRRMAATASTPDIREALIRLAERLEKLAQKRQVGEEA